MLANESLQAFCQTNEAYTESTLIDNRLYGVCRLKFLATNPELRHKQRELLSESRLLEFETMVELAGCNLKHIIELSKELADTLFLILYIHTLDSQTHDVDGREREVTTSNRSLWSEAILEHSCAASHSSHLILVALRIVGTPLLMLVECSIKVEEVREESASCHLASQLIEVVVWIFRKIVNATLLLPNLNWEDSCFAISYTLVC